MWIIYWVILPVSKNRGYGSAVWNISSCLILIVEQIQAILVTVGPWQLTAMLGWTASNITFYFTNSANTNKYRLMMHDILCDNSCCNVLNAHWRHWALCSYNMPQKGSSDPRTRLEKTLLVTGSSKKLETRTIHSATCRLCPFVMRMALKVSRHEDFKGW